MNKFQKASVPASETEPIKRELIRKIDAGDPDTLKLVRDLIPAPNPTREEMVRTALRYIDQTRTDCEYWINDKYQVAVRKKDNSLIHLSIKRLDRECVHDWRELQQIKSELVGPENEAVELYPAESRVVDTANQFHLWVASDPGYRFPFGFNAGRVVTDSPLAKSKNRTLNERK
jgi:hypothetical protein